MTVLRKLIKSSAFWIVALELILIVVLGFFGFRITYSPNLNDCWTAIGAMGQWASACVGVLIPIAAVILQHRLDKNKEDISKSNIAMLEELEDFKRKYEKQLMALSSVVDEDGDIDGGTFLELDAVKWQHFKEEAVKFIDISMMAKTHGVADHLKISNDDAFRLLKELALHDHLISCAGQLTDKNIDGIIWLPKSGK